MAAVASEKALHSVQRLYLALLDAFPAYVQDFEAKWQTWQLATASLSDPSAWPSAPGFDALVALGPKAIPAVLQCLASNQDDAKAVYLYNKLESDLDYQTDANADLSQQVCSVLEKNFIRNRAIRNALLDWAEHCDMVSRQSSSVFYTECEEYDELVRLGPCVIPQLMLQYKKKDGLLFAYELLHEILWGYQTGLQTIFMDREYNMWAEWFEKKSYDQAPQYYRRFPARQDEAEGGFSAS
ncbi:hypothetical protein MFIFM68171_01753 [Madurella fahalii]|uniref:Uncharacterized protein n=1 Tax=Madurella fahalii TaxID=1157608 RepID=A0ABQ0G1A3_9PEZI